MIVSNIQCKDSKIMVPIFKSIVRSVIEYGNPVWNTTLRKHTDAIENVQRRFTKRVKQVRNMTYEQRLQVLKLPSLEFRMIRGDMIETFKITQGYYDSKTTNSLFKLYKDNVTRGHPFKLNKISTNTSKYANFFTNRVINYWNLLPESVVTAETVNTFKNRFDIYSKKILYKTNIELH